MLGVNLVTCWLVRLASCCAIPSLLVEGGVGSCGGWFINGTVGDANAGCADVVGVWTLILMLFSSTSSGDGVVNAGGATISTRGGGAVFTVTSTGSTITTI